MPSGLTGIYKKTFQSGTTTLVFSNEDLNDMMKKIKSLKECGLLIKGVIETIKNEAKEKKGGFLGILLDTLDASLLGNMIACKGVRGVGKRISIAGPNF